LPEHGATPATRHIERGQALCGRRNRRCEMKRLMVLAVVLCAAMPGSVGAERAPDL
jgi:hypothetical protein